MSERDPPRIDDERIVRAQLAAVVCVAESGNVLERSVAVRLVCDAVDRASRIPGAMLGTDEEVCRRLTLAGESALYQVRAARFDRELLVARISRLPLEQKTAYSLRLDGMSDWQIGKAMNIDEDAVVLLILKATMALAGASNAEHS